MLSRSCKIPSDEWGKFQVERNGVIRPYFNDKGFIKGTD